MRNIAGFLVGVLLIEAFQKRNATYAKQGQPYKPFLISRMQEAIAALWSSKIRRHRPSQTIT